MRGLVLVVSLAAISGCASWPAPGTVSAGDAVGEGSGANPAATAPEAAVPAPVPRPRATPPPVYHPAGQALIEQARQQTAAGDLEAAGSTLERALRVDPDNPWIWVELARVRSAAGDVRGARSMASRAVGLAGQDPDAEAAARRLLGSGSP